MDKTFSIEANWMVVTAISAVLWLLGLLAKVVFDACMRALEPREAVVRALSVLRDPSAFAWDAYGKLVSTKHNAFIDAYGDVYFASRKITTHFTRREAEKINAAVKRVLAYHRAIDLNTTLDEAGA